MALQPFSARRQVLPTMDLRTPAQRRGETNLQQNIQAIAGILQTLGKAEKTRRERQDLDAISRAIAGGADITEAINAVAKRKPEFSPGLPGIFQRVGGLGITDGGGISQDLQKAIIGQRLKQALTPSLLSPKEEREVALFGKRDRPGEQLLTEEERTKAAKIKAGLEPKAGTGKALTLSERRGQRIDKEIAAGTLKEGSPRHLRLLGVAGAAEKTPEKKLQFWQTVLQKTKDALGTDIEGQEGTSKLAQQKIEEALRAIEKQGDEVVESDSPSVDIEAIDVPEGELVINKKTGKPAKVFNKKGEFIGFKAKDGSLVTGQDKVFSRDIKFSHGTVDEIFTKEANEGKTFGKTLQNILAKTDEQGFTEESVTAAFNEWWNENFQQLKEPTRRGGSLRTDGTKKSTGFRGVLTLPNGDTTSEYSVGTTDVTGEEIDIPTLVTTLTQEEEDLMVNDIIPNRKQPPKAIMQKAIIHAKKRIAEGKSPFAQEGEQIEEIPTPKTQAEFDAIPSGTEFEDTDGKRKIKK